MSRETGSTAGAGSGTGEPAAARAGTGPARCSRLRILEDSGAGWGSPGDWGY